MKVILLRQPLVYLRSALIGFFPLEAKVVSHSGLFNNIRKGWHKRGGVEGGKGRKRKYCIFIGCISF